MFLDFENCGAIPDGFDVCIVGAGVAGLTAAWALTQSGARVLIIEAGGFGDEERSQSLFDTEVEFVAEQNLGVTARFRTFGGNGTRWGGQLIPLTEGELGPRPVIGHEGWPIDSRSLSRHLAKALEMVEIRDAIFDASCYQARNRRALGFDSDVLTTRLSKWIPWRRRNIGRFLKPALTRDPNILVLLHANAVEILLNESNSSVAGIRTRSYGGREHVVTAKSYILAAGTIEVCRLLLASRGQRPWGVGNQRDLVGRWFMDHTFVRAGFIVPLDRKALLDGVRPFFIRNVMHTPRFELTSQVQSNHRCLSAYVLVRFEARPGSALAELFATFKQFQAEGMRGLLKGRYWALLSGLPDVAAALLARTVLGLRPIPTKSTPVVYLSSEQPPRRDSRIYLTEKRDAIGMPKVAMHWSIGEEEERTLFVIGRLFDEQLRKHNVGRMQWEGFDPYAGTRTVGISDHYHHLGGARMSLSEDDGVVDRDCRVYGVRNLYIASGATFPTSGSTNPTFTIMALAVRLAEHLVSCR
jgi:choline dehydrogenase-like flavoprotein